MPLAAQIPPGYNKEKCLRTLPDVLWGTIPPPLVENCVLVESSALGESVHREASEMGTEQWHRLEKGESCLQHGEEAGLAGNNNSSYSLRANNVTGSHFYP